MPEVQSESQYDKGVKHLCENGIKKVPNKYILPNSDQPSTGKEAYSEKKNIKLPVIDLAQLKGPNRAQVLESLAHACEQYGFFQVVNHGVPKEVIASMIDVSKRFFELPFEERVKYMSSDVQAPVRYGTSFNQNKDSVFCWRDFLKLTCHPSTDVLPHWPSSPPDFRKLAAAYSKESKNLFLQLVEAILESLELWGRTKGQDEILQELKDGSQLMVANCYPTCPEPGLTLGMPPHSDYGFLTLLLQDEVKGLQVQFEGKWVTVEPIPNAFIVNIGDHLEIFSNGRYKSVLHRVLVNSEKTRFTVASLHSVPSNCTVKPSQKLIDKDNPRCYKDTNFASFLEYLSSSDSTNKSFLQSRKLT